QYAQLLQDSAREMNQLIEDLLNFSRLSRQPLAMVPTDLTAICHTVAADVKARHSDRALFLDVQSTPPCHADPALIKQVLANLLDNAFKYTRKKPDAIVEFGWQAVNGKNAYYVKDNG